MSVARHHLDWQQLIDISGPWLSMLALLRAFPDGLDKPDDTSTLRTRIHAAYDEWLDNQGGLAADPAIHRAWLRFVLREVLELDEALLVEGQAIPASCMVKVAEHGAQLIPKLALLDPAGRPSAGKPRMLVDLVPRTQSLDGPLAGSGWKASPATRMTTLLHGAGVRLGLVTNGEQWMLVHAVPGETTTYASFYANLFLEEPLTLRALQSLLGARRFFSVADADTLEALIAESSGNQQEVTDQLGSQVRRAVEVLIQTIDRIDRDRKRVLLRGTDEKVLYESAVTVMMRLVFLFAAEERKLLLLGDPLYDQHYAVSTLRDQLQTVADQHGSEVLQRRHDAWSRLLATFRAVHGGVRHEAMRLPAYGGSLFDPDRFPFLEGRAAATVWASTEASPLPIDNLTVLDVLSALQVLQVKIPGGGTEPRRLSFRALDVEQLGHVYEGLLDHTAKRATTPVVSLRGSKNLEPEVEVAELEKRKRGGDAGLVDFLVEETGRSRPAIQKGMAYQIPKDDQRRYLAACDNHEALYQRISPWAGIIRDDVHGHPVIFDEGSVYVTEGAERRSTGTHYTPRTLTEPIVQYTLEPLVYEGPAEGWAKETWRLRGARELLALRVCDLAMGSGAFLVQACRYLALRVVEAWDAAEKAAGGRLVVTPEGDLGTGSPAERALPRDDEERVAIAQRIVADRCLYGVDINPMAVEMAKLSLWLVTLQKDRPFTFVDHALRAGDSLLGLTDVAQLERFHLDPKRAGTIPMGVEVIRPAVQRAVELRQAIERRVTETLEDAVAKARLLEEAREATDDLRLVADIIVGAALATAARGARALDEKLVDLAEPVRALLSEKTAAEGRTRLRGELRERGDALLNEGRGQGHGEKRPFHWALEFPEVFAGERGGFDAFVGNPPFMHGSLIATRFSAQVAEFLRVVTPGTVGKIDYCVYLVRRAAALTAAAGGVCGLVVTAKLGTGDARRAGYNWLSDNGREVRFLREDMPWPGGASVLVSLPILSWRQPKFHSSNALAERSDTQLPNRLVGNVGLFYLGAKPDSLGFVLSPTEADSLLSSGAGTSDVVRPYFTGEDFGQMPVLVPRRYIIDLSGLSQHEAEQRFPALLEIVRQRVMPKRLELKRQAYRDRWWQFTEPQKALFQEFRKHRSGFAFARVSRWVIPRLVPTSVCCSEQLVVFSQPRMDLFGVASSELHTQWAQRYSGVHGSGSSEYTCYRQNDAGVTFPWPSEAAPTLAKLAAELANDRETLFAATNRGPTDIYVSLHNPKGTMPELERLREVHRRLDHAVAAAYGWTDLDLGHGFHETKQGLRYTISEPARREVLDRLLELNHQRYAEEVAKGLHDTGKKAKAPQPKLPPEPAPPPLQASRGQQTGFGFADGPLFFNAQPQAQMPSPVAPPPPAPPPAPRPGATLSPPAAKLRDALVTAAVPMGKAALIAASGITEAAFSAAIRELIAANLIEQQGEKRGTKYVCRKT